MKYLVKTEGRYYYNRRVPEEAREFDHRKVIRVSLKTDSKEQAQRKAVVYSEQIEAYWQSLVDNKQLHDDARFKRVISVARKMGFAYQPMSVLSTVPIVELIERVLALKEGTPQQVEALLGGKPQPLFTLSAATELYWTICSDKTVNKTPHQLRKWKGIRQRAVNNFINLHGDKDVLTITREDTVALRDWWVGRIRDEGLNADSANKDLINLRSILTAVSEHKKLGVDILHLFNKLMLTVRFKKTRLPFTSDQILKILTSEKLNRMNDESKWFLFAAAETGARPAELAGLMPDDIKLHDPIPHICITDRADRPLKNAHSERKIPLVGYALEAFQNMPAGFPRYRDKPENLTVAINGFLRENRLLPSNRHTTYSFRHSFQDRILSVNAPDRVQAELMGHKFNRPMYGDGASLDLKLDWLKQIALQNEL